MVPSSSRRRAQRRVEAAGVDAAVPAHHALARDADLRQRRVGGRARGEHDLAGAVEERDRAVHRLDEPRLAAAQPGVGGQLGVVAAEQRQPERARDERGGDPGGAGRADVDRVEAAVRERLRRRPAGSARRSAGRGRTGTSISVTAARRRSTSGSVPTTSISKPGHAALADLLDRAADAVGRADAVGDDRHPRRRRRAAGAAARPSGCGGDRAQLGLLVGEERGGRRVGDGGDAGVEQPAGRARRVGLAVCGRERQLDGAGEAPLVRAAGAPEQVAVAEVLGLHVRDQLRVRRARRGRPRAATRASRRARRRGETSPPALPSRRSPSRSSRAGHAQHAQRVGLGRAARPSTPSVRIASAIAACAHLAALPWAPRAVASPARMRARNAAGSAARRRFRPRAARCRRPRGRRCRRCRCRRAWRRRSRRAGSAPVRGRRCAPPRRRTARPGGGGGAPSAAPRPCSRGGRARRRSRARTCRPRTARRRRGGPAATRGRRA